MSASTLIFDPEIAARLGLKEAIFLQRVHYWLKEASQHPDKRLGEYRTSRWWIYNTLEQWREQLVFISERSLQRVIAKLIRLKLLLSESIAGRSWYTLDYQTLAALDVSADNGVLHVISSRQTGAEGDKVASGDAKTAEGDARMAQTSRQNGVTPIYKESGLTQVTPGVDADRRAREAEYDHLMEEARAVVEQIKTPAAAEPQPDPELATVFRAYQDNIGVTSQIIADQIADAVRDYSATWVQEAIKVAVSAEARSWRYVNGVLKGWKRDGLALPPTLAKVEPPAKASKLKPPDPDCPHCKGTGTMGNNQEGFAVCSCRKEVTHASA